MTSNEQWTCAAITNGITFFPNNKIAPCCVIDHSYRKNITDLKTGNPFADIKERIEQTNCAPSECRICTKQEANNVKSYRQGLNHRKQPWTGYQYIDIRNSKVCNLSCRTCGPHSSSLWEKEFGIEIDNFTDLTDYLDIIVNDSVTEIYFTGGEPLLNPCHWEVLDGYIKQEKSQNVSLRYNSNVSTLKYKDKSIFDYWKHFGTVDYHISIDAVGEKLNSLRSGSNWALIEKNIQDLLEYRDKMDNLKLTTDNVVSNLNIWFLDEYIKYFNNIGIDMWLSVLEFPDYYSLDCLPPELIELANRQVDQALTMPLSQESISQLMYAKNKIQKNQGQSLFLNTIASILLLDKIRKENLFDYLPFSQVAYKQVVNNNG